ncbi:MAG: acyloxyacyl hydrolase [Alphaproteobacteria bacterium]
MRQLLAALLLTTLFAGTAAAEVSTAIPSNGSGDIDVYGGPYSVFRDPKDRSVEFGAEYRWADQWNGIRPTIGIMANTDRAVYPYAGIYWDLPLGTAPFVITPGVAVGLYDHGNSKPLGSAIEFRDTIEATYRFNDGERLGAQLTHMSNASIGNKNPGVESYQIIYSHPFSW